MGDHSNQCRYIETVRYRGYRFIAPIEFLKEEELARVSSSSFEALTIAVLPFDSFTSGEEEQSWGLGLADALITRLSAHSHLTVRPIWSIRKYLGMGGDPVEIGREMKVNSVLTGNFQMSGAYFRATVQLVNVSEGIAVWSAKFDDRFTDRFTVQDLISEKLCHEFLQRFALKIEPKA